MSDSKAISCGSTHRICVAPMMDYTDRHFRYFIRLMSRYTRLYTEMVTTGAILRGEQRRFLDFHQVEHPLALQLGGCEPTALAECARIAADYGYDEINLNAGCPSDRVQSGRFGACLMAEPELVAKCIATMQRSVDIPVTVKCRIGIDQQDSREALYHFIATNADAGCKTFIIHARKAWLKGLSPKENREVPPLRYEVVEQLKQDFPELEIIINGGIKTIDSIKKHLEKVDGVMIGREAYHNPYLLSDMDYHFFSSTNDLPEQSDSLIVDIPSRGTILTGIAKAMDEGRIGGRYVRPMARHMMGLFQGQAFAREWRRFLSEEWLAKPTGSALLDRAFQLKFL